MLIHYTRCTHILELHSKLNMFLRCWYITQNGYTYWSSTTNHTGTCVTDTLHKMYTHIGAAQQTKHVLVLLIITQNGYTYWSFTANHTGTCVGDTLHKMYTQIGAAQQTKHVPVMLIHYTRYIHILELHSKPHRYLCWWYITQDRYTYLDCTTNHKRYLWCCYITQDV